MNEIEDARKLGECENCGYEVTGDHEVYYVDSEGKIFCCIECLLDYYEISVIEV